MRIAGNGIRGRYRVSFPQRSMCVYHAVFIMLIMQCVVDGFEDSACEREKKLTVADRIVQKAPSSQR